MTQGTEAFNVGTKRHRYLKVKYGKMVAVVTAMQKLDGTLMI